MARKKPTRADIAAELKTLRGGTPNATLSAKSPAPKKSRRNKRRALGRDKRKYYWIDEVADLTGTSTRTIQRDIDDGKLIATWFRGACRIADRDLQTYLRKQRGLALLLKRRRSPRKICNPKNNGETQ
jgi:excisionase family DNA binding protein